MIDLIKKHTNFDFLNLQILDFLTFKELLDLELLVLPQYVKSMIYSLLLK